MVPSGRLALCFTQAICFFIKYKNIFKNVIRCSFLKNFIKAQNEN
jgi:hypothetical protein